MRLYGFKWVVLGPYRSLCVLMGPDGFFLVPYASLLVLMSPYNSLSILMFFYFSIFILHSRGSNGGAFILDESSLA